MTFTVCFRVLSSTTGRGDGREESSIQLRAEADTWNSCFCRNFIGEKIVRRVTMLSGVDVEISKNQKDELTLTGNSLENVSQSAADIQQICRVRNKDIRKVIYQFHATENVREMTD